MSGQLNRLQAFLAGAGELEVITPSPALRPDHFARFARLLGATVLVTHVAAVAAAPESAPAPAPAAAAISADVPAARARATTQASILAVKEIAARYLSHGRSPLKPSIVMMNPDEDPDQGPEAMAVAGDVCRVDGVRTDYSKADPHLARMAGTPEMRAQVLVHESMHCRLGPALLRYTAKFPSPNAIKFATTFSESSADAMAILTVARRDGVPAALRMLDQWYAVRGDEAASPEADGYHDSRETLNRIRHLLVTSPEKVNSDSAAFSLAITEGLAGASKTFAAALPAESKGYIGSREYMSNMAGFHLAVEEMARGYLEGPYELGRPEVTFNAVTAPPDPAIMPSSWRLLAEHLKAPAFTPASLRKEVEAITESFAAAAATDAPARTLASAAAPAPAPGSAQAIGLLRSRLGAIYINPVSADQAPVVDPDHHPAEEPHAPAM